MVVVSPSSSVATVAMVPPELISLDPPVVSDFVARYEIYEKLVAGNRVPIHSCVPLSVVEAAVVYDAESFSNEDKLKAYLNGLYQFGHIDQAENAFKKCFMNEQTLSKVQAFTEYLTVFMRLKSRSSDLTYTDKLLQIRFARGLRPNNYSKTVLTRIDTNLYNTLNDLISETTKDIKSIDQYAPYATTSTSVKSTSNAPRNSRHNGHHSHSKSRRSFTPAYRVDAHSQDLEDRTCFHCHKPGHRRENCPQLVNVAPIQDRDTSARRPSTFSNQRDTYNLRTRSVSKDHSRANTPKPKAKKPVVQAVEIDDSLAYLQELTLRIKAKVELAQNIQDKRMSKIPEQSNVPKFKVNDLVLRVSPRRLSKLHGHEGPFLVTSVLGSNGYRITNMLSKYSYTASQNQLIRFNGDPNDPKLKHLIASDLEEYIIEAILSHHEYEGVMYFETKWVDGPITYEPLDHVKDNEVFKLYKSKNKIDLTKKTVNKKKR
ncbi:hypothetical protein RCL1_000338 [Eukaryota sp. TZLM3-RCL]